MISFVIGMAAGVCLSVIIAGVLLGRTDATILGHSHLELARMKAELAAAIEAQEALKQTLEDERRRHRHRRELPGHETPTQLGVISGAHAVDGAQ
ncbi:MAG: hypothetical protein H3C34_00710 [Caldilineaceae bacterium]|nr:hypothetical protein [Caldilineaceae bacterium]